MKRLATGIKRVASALLAFQLSLPCQAWALRPNQAETAQQRAGLEGALQAAPQNAGLEGFELFVKLLDRLTPSELEQLGRAYFESGSLEKRVKAFVNLLLNLGAFAVLPKNWTGA